MKVPSLHYLVLQARETFLRFPLPLFAALALVITALFFTENFDTLDNKLPYINVILTFGLGIPLFFCATILTNKLDLSRSIRIVFFAAAAFIVCMVYFTFPDSDSTHNISLPYIKYGIYNITIHLLVSFLPFSFSPQLNGFWQYNKILFIRLWTAILFSGVLFIGLVLAFVSITLLFDIKIHDHFYLQLFIICAGLVNTWIFLAGIPKDLEGLEEIQLYPKGLKIFAQFILLPLLMIYLVILYMYGGKILIGWNWPKGIVSYLIIYISVLGILSFLLLHPYGEYEENTWIKKLSRIYYMALLPLIVILFIAIFMRINDYGITINRYVIVLLGIWLLLVCIYTIVGRTNIKFIPASLAMMLLFMSFGPWGMFSISERAQVKRLQEILVKSGIMIDSRIKNEVMWTCDTLHQISSDRENCNEGKLNDSLHNEIWSILNYLDDHHGFSSIKGWYVQDIDSICVQKDGNNKVAFELSEAALYMQTLGLKYHQINTPVKNEFINYHANVPDLKAISNYDYSFAFDENIHREEEVKIDFVLDSLDCKLRYTFAKDTCIRIVYNDSIVFIDLAHLVKTRYSEFGNESPEKIPLQKMQISAKVKQYEFVFEFHAMEIIVKETGPVIEAFSGDLYIRRIRP